MRLSSAAIGLAAVGAGWLVARMVLARHGGGPGPVPEPPNPGQLIGQSPPHLSVLEAAEAFHSSKPRPR
jgi:hypothetical protein